MGIAEVLDLPGVYGLWQAPFAERKIAPVLRHNDISSVRRVLDVGCGPGTNAVHFVHTDYVGIDLNSRYTESATRRFGRRFIAADVTQYKFDDAERFDFILVNSLLHHLNTSDVRYLLAYLAGLLTPDGVVHILDLVLPEEPSVARRLAQWDRGKFARQKGEWREIFERDFTPILFEAYGLGVLRLTFWNMIYFKGTVRRG